MQLGFRSNYLFLKRIDALPKGPKWSVELWNAIQDEGVATAKDLYLELWKRNPVECIRELIGNPAFRDRLHYAPQKLYTSHDNQSRIYDEMWTGNWWWNIQVS